MPIIMKDQYNPLSDAIRAGTQAFDQYGAYQGREAQRASSLAQAAKLRAETGVIGAQQTAMQGLPGQFSQAYRLQHGLLPEEERAGAYGDVMGGFVAAGGKDIKPYTEGMGQMQRNLMLTQGAGMIEEDPSVAAQFISAGNKLAMPDMMKISGDYAYNPMDPASSVQELAGAGRSNKPVPVTIDGQPSMAVWTGSGYEPVAGVSPPATGSMDPRGKLRAGERWTQLPGGDWGGEPIPGTDKRTPEQSAKIAMLSQGMKDLDKAKTIIYDEQGNVNTGVLAMMQGANIAGMSGVPGTQSRELYSLIYNAIEGKLRAESGAAVPDSEVVRMAKRFVPSALDNDDTVRSKLERLDDFMIQSLELNYPAGVPESLIPTQSLSGAVDDQIAPELDIYQGAQIGDTYTAPDGTLRRRTQ